jgi:Zn-dependent M28 family amino/carboxypeptidase
MVLDFAKALAAKKGKHKYSYAFLLFSGEEAGLLGSRHYVENPLFSLSKIKQVLNFDMVATGSGGVNIFNGAVLKSEFALLDSINKVNNFGLELKAKSTSRSSDHYPFHQKQVPALFILTDGKEVGYHIPQDRFEKLPFTAYQKLFKLIYQYIEAKENGKIIYSTNSDR